MLVPSNGRGPVDGDGDNVQVAIRVDTGEDPKTGVRFVTLTAAIAPLTPGGPQLLNDLNRRLHALAPVIIGEKLEATDPRLHIPAPLVRALTPPAELLETMGGPAWLHTLLLELLELRRECSRQWAEAHAHERPTRNMTAFEHFRLAQTILLDERDVSGNIRHALEHLEAGIVAVEQP
jgi:hypothetical protein